MTIDWPVLSFVVNLIIGGACALLLRWVGGIVKDLQQQITIAVQQLQIQFQKEYATKEELREGLNIVGRIDEGLASVKLTLREQGSCPMVPDRTHSNPPR